MAPGDRLHLEFEASRDLYLYVMEEDDRGEAYVLYPLPGSGATNPLAGGRMHRLPPARDGRAYSWGVSSVGGTEHLLIIAAIVLPLLGALLWFRKDITRWVKDLWDRIRSDASPDLMP